MIKIVYLTDQHLDTSNQTLINNVFAKIAEQVIKAHKNARFRFISQRFKSGKVSVYFGQIFSSYTAEAQNLFSWRYFVPSNLRRI